MTELQFTELIQVLKQLGGLSFGCMLSLIVAVTWKG